MTKKTKKETYLELVQQSQDKRKGRSKNLVDITLEGERPIILPLGCTHIGSPESNEPLLLENLEWAFDNKSVYIMGQGDWLEAATRTSVGAGVYEQKIHTGKQYDKMMALMQPFAKEKRIIGITNGNHEDRIYMNTGVDISKLMAQNLNVPYLKYGGFYKVKVGTQNYHIYATHGSSGAKLPYTKIKSCYDLARFIDADLYVMGHVHDCQVHTQEYQSIDNRNKKIDYFYKYFVLNGHYLNWQDGYAQSKSMIPSKQGTPKIKLHGDKKMIRVSI